MTATHHPWTGRRVLVTGANGFVGSHLVSDLVKRGAEVIAVTRPGADLWRLEPRSAGIEVVAAELEDLSRCLSASRIDLVYHLAAAGTRQSDSDAESILRTNVLGTYKVLELALSRRAMRIVCAGTGFEYGALSKATEAAALRPRTAYAASKAAASLIVYAVAVRERISALTLRTFSVYGPGQARHFVVPYSVTNALANRPIRLRGAGHRRDFIYVDDVVDAYIRAADADLDAGSVLNIGSGHERLVTDVVEKIITLAKSSSRLITTPGGRPNEVSASSADPGNAERGLDWYARVGLEDGLQRTIAWFASNSRLYDQKYPDLEPFP